jgi:hypothetical protein
VIVAYFRSADLPELRQCRLRHVARPPWCLYHHIRRSLNLSPTPVSPLVNLFGGSVVVGFRSGDLPVALSSSASSSSGR